MFRLALILHLFIGSTLAGTGVIVALVAGYTTVTAILLMAALGFALSMPVTWLIARKLYSVGA
ncbi:CTP synthetase [Shimia abyssi]|uniref:CTP synthetase n=1 Tax=Shimia abyssi TaxID=1662395 RepID=A0A2P8FK96_9RHOB|nr:CTP synthetase [Shimia abyssi]PSL22146.1 hypothetical protein CLV88_101571 [Shimia abyssi]